MNKKKDFLPIYDITKYKYLLNMNGYSYAGRLNYLFLSGSCVIILKNENKKHCYNEFFYNYFIPNEDYIEIIYNDNEDVSHIIKRINKSINNIDNKEMSRKCFEKAKKIFQINNIYKYIYNLTKKLSEKNIINSYLDNTIFYTPPLNYNFSNRIEIINNKINFNFKGVELELIILNQYNDYINIKITTNNSIIFYNNQKIFENNIGIIFKNNQPYDIVIIKNKLFIIIDKKNLFLVCDLPNEIFNMNNISIKTELYGGWWIT